MSADTLSRIVVTHRYAVRAERVFDAFLDVETASRFLFATPNGEMLTARIDARVGGRFEFTERRPDMGDVRHVGEYLQIERPQRLVFTFGVPQLDPRMTTVTIEIRAEGEACELTLTHDGILPGYVERTREGWSRILAGLAAAWDGVRAAGWD